MISQKSFLLFLVPMATASNYEELPPDYQTLSGAKKQDLLWSNIENTVYDINNLPFLDYGIASAQLLLPSFDAKSFSHESDEMIEGRPKVIHTYGSAAKIELQIDANSPYTGVFAPGSKIGIARVSLARRQVPTYIPGIVIKLLVDGLPSINLIAMYDLEGQGFNKNFFEHDFSNFVPHPKTLPVQILAHQFQKGSDSLPGGVCDKPIDGLKLPNYTPASVSPDGSVNPSPVVPLQYFLKPNPDLGWSPHDQTDFRVHVANIPVDTLLYTMTAKATADAEEQVIGRLVLKSPFLASDYGDNKLYFQHHAKQC